MNEYEKQANDFLEKYGYRIEKKFICKRPYFAGETQARNVYQVTIYRNDDVIEKNNDFYSFSFGDSIANSNKMQAFKDSYGYDREKRVSPTNYDILACLTKDFYCDDVFDFASEYGYEINDKKSYNRVFKTYEAVRNEYENVSRLFVDCMDELREIQ